MDNTLTGPMMQDIMEQPERIRLEIHEYRQSITHGFVKLVLQQSFDRVVFCGSGSVATAAWVLKYAARKFLKTETEMLYSSLLVHHSDLRFPVEPLEDNLLLVCPAESGCTKGPVDLARMAAAQGIPFVCTSLSLQSPLSRVSTLTIPKYSGQERARPSTKGYTSGVLSLTLCFLDGGIAQGKLPAGEAAALNQELERLPDSCQSILHGAKEWYDRCRSLLCVSPHFRFVGYGANYGTAMEGALKFEEAGKRLSKAYELEEFIHGPMGALQADEVVFFLFGEDGPEHARMETVMACIKKITKNCIAVGSLPVTAQGTFDYRFSLSSSPQLNPIELILPLQYVAAALAFDLGLDTAKASYPELRKYLQASYPSQVP